MEESEVGYLGFYPRDLRVQEAEVCPLNCIEAEGPVRS